MFTAAIDPEFLRIFDLEFKAGDAATAMSSEHSAILTERTAERLFGTTHLLGRRILLQTRVEVTITGVIAQILVFPPGALAAVPGVLRYGAVAAGFAAFLASRKSILIGVICGEIVMLAGEWWLGS